ncbi:MAG: acyl carrier protein [Minicystis sp.]
MSDIRAVVRDFILTQCLPGEAPENLQDDTALRTSGVLDSMTTLKLVSAIEAAAGIEVEAHDVSDDNFESVEKIVAFVEQRRAGR